MAKKSVTKFFEEFIKKEPLFMDKVVLQSNYHPDDIPHRETQIHQIAQILAPALRKNKPSNLFIYGKTGTGKTVSVNYTAKQILDVAEKNGNTNIKIIYVNCKLKKIADTEYRLIAQLARELGKEIPITGLPTDEVYKMFFNALDESQTTLVLVLDEIDQLVKKTGDEILYNLTRINSELKRSQVSIIGISNDLIFADNLDPRVKSSLSEEEIIFPPYNAFQIQDILRQRAEMAFKKEVLEPGVIEKCAAYAAREHGDARRALELLRVAAEVAERNGQPKVQIKDIDEAEEKIEKERVVDIVIAQPKQFQITLYSILSVYAARKDTIFTGEIYEIYKGLCTKTGQRPLTQRRVSDIIAELDMLGIINAKVTSKGRYGRTREIDIAVNDAILEKIKFLLEKELDIKPKEQADIQ
ncbi:MAG: ORC1-type DNA replication protein [Candidatus Woesearchaeota archaeon]|nr:ORC1-type DNA replication protein [Candidatus Woesearchaeota archaeon]